MEDHGTIGEFDKWFGKCESLSTVRSFNTHPSFLVLADCVSPKGFDESGAYQRSQPSAIPADKNECCND